MERGYFLTGDPKVRPHTDGHDLWTFEEAIGFKDAAGWNWWTADTFVSDGASIPKPLQAVLGHPFKSDYIRPAALHDFFYQTWASAFTGQLASRSRLAVDKMLLDALLADGVLPPKAYMIYAGVRTGGWWAWRQHSKE